MSKSRAYRWCRLMAEAKYTGELKKGDSPNTIVGVIRDSWGWEIHLIGTRNDSGGYTLSGSLGPTPPALWINAIDGPTGDAA